MEELQSTEMLDREILEDARKKAARTLKSAEDTIRAQDKEWEKRTAEGIDDLEKKYIEQKELAAEKIMARLPIDKRRTKVEKIEKMLDSAAESWYKSLSRGRILDLLAVELKKRISLCEEFSDSTEKRAFFCGLDVKEAETTLKNVNIACKLEESHADGQYPSIVIETGNVRITASIQKIVDYLLQEKREELVEALVGRDFMEAL
ncbi:MAG: ATPase [Treponema sp.]|jgi:uncharacterized membrane protein YheB (UPF0754 family)|nr:ATPase [Treponema sp.]